MKLAMKYVRKVPRHFLEKLVIESLYLLVDALRVINVLVVVGRWGEWATRQARVGRKAGQRRREYRHGQVLHRAQQRL